MLNKLKALPQKAYLSVSSFLSGLKNDQRGLSGVVVAVLLILVAVLAIVLIWGFLSGWLNDLWENIFGQADAIN